MEDMACSDQVGCTNIKSTDHLLRELLNRVTRLEQQISLKSQPLLYQISDKCDKLDVSLKGLKRGLDRRFEEVRSELTNLYHQPRPAGISYLAGSVGEGSESDGEDQDPEWHPELEEESPNQGYVDWKPYPCRFCPSSSGAVFNGAEGLAEHYTRQHPLAMPVLPEPTRRSRGRTGAVFEQSSISSSIPGTGMVINLTPQRSNSDQESDDTSDQEQLQTPKKGRKLETWVKKQTFSSADEAFATVSGAWCKRCKNDQKDGRHVLYYCRTHGQKCSAKIKLVYPHDRLEVDYYENDPFQLQHDAQRQRNVGFPEEIKQAVLQLMREGVEKPNRILGALAEKNLPTPHKKKLISFLQYARKKYDIPKRVDAVAALGLDPEPDPADVQSDSVPPSHRRVLCPECGRSVLRGHLPVHLRTHTGERSHVCETCGAAFKGVMELTIHQRRHTGERPFVCTHPGCEKRFMSRTTLQGHSYIHTGKPYVCEECGRTFLTAWMLKMHKKKYAGECGTAPGLMMEESGAGEGTIVKRKRGRPPKRRQEQNPEMREPASALVSAAQPESNFLLPTV